MTMVVTVIFVFGLIIGSFLNALIYRLSVADSVFRGRSYCPDCKHVLASRDLVPVVSYIALRSRCRYCKKKISIQYPAVELATAISFLLIYLRFIGGGSQHALLMIGAYMLYTCFLIVIFVYDLRYYLILDVVTLPAIVIGFALNMLLGVSWVSMLMGAIVAGGFFALQFFFSRGKWIGGGDIRLGALMGVLTPWPYILVALFIAYLSGSIIGMGLMMSRMKHLESKLPFGTFLTVATFITMLWGPQLLQWYLHFYV